MTILQERLKNCLQTIVDIQPFLNSIFKKQLKPDMLVLAQYLDKVEKMDLREDEVRRLEQMTSKFLNELKFARHYPLNMGKLH